MTDPSMADQPIGITVVLVTYNHELYIRQALESILAQKVSVPIEIIISEDRSTDSTFEIIEEISEEHPSRFLIMRSEVNLANQDVSSRAIGAARGKYIAFLDGDDYWVSSEKLQRQFDFMELHPDCAVCYHDIARVSEAGEVVRIIEGASDRANIDDLIMGNFIPSCASFIRRSAIENPPAWMRDMEAGDWPFYLVAAQSGWIGRIEGVLAHYRIHGGALWSTRPLVEQWVRSLSMLMEIESHFGDEHRDAFLRSRKNIVANIVTSLDRERRLEDTEIVQFEQEQEFHARTEEVEQRIQNALQQSKHAEMRANSAEIAMREAILSAKQAHDSAEQSRSAEREASHRADIAEVRFFDLQAEFNRQKEQDEFLRTQIQANLALVHSNFTQIQANMDRRDEDLKNLHSVTMQLVEKRGQLEANIKRIRGRERISWVAIVVLGILSAIAISWIVSV